jgi:hypothetical protein
MMLSYSCPLDLGSQNLSLTGLDVNLDASTPHRHVRYLCGLDGLHYGSKSFLVSSRGLV